MDQKERAFYEYIAPKLRAHGHLQRIESGQTSPGIPDMCLCINGIEAWIELKVASPHVLLRKEQYAWGVSASAYGRKCYVLAWDPEVEHVLLWGFACFRVEPVGRGDKYVRIVTPPRFTASRSVIAEFLITNVFTPAT